MEVTGYEARQTSKEQTKMPKIYVRRSTTLHNLLFCVHTLCMNYVTSTFLLVSSSVRSKQLLCFVQGQGQKREQKHTTKNFVWFHNHCALLTMSSLSQIVRIQGKSVSIFTLFIIFFML